MLMNWGQCKKKYMHCNPTYSLQKRRKNSGFFLFPWHILNMHAYRQTWDKPMLIPTTVCELWLFCYMGHAATKPDKVNIWSCELKESDVANKWLKCQWFILSQMIWFSIMHKSFLSKMSSLRIKSRISISV